MLICFFFTFVCFSSEVLSNSLSPCKISDEACVQQLGKMLLPQVFSGIPNLEVESSDPLFMEKIEGNLSVISYTFFNTTVIGFKDCHVSNLELSEDLTKINYDLIFPRFQMSGKYEMNGRLVLLQVEGKGDYYMSSGKYKVHVDSELKTFKGDDEKIHIMIQNYKLKCEALEPLYFDYKNLFNGQKDLSDAVHKFAHENWKEVADLLQDPIFYAILKKTISNSNKYFKQVPLEEILHI